MPSPRQFRIGSRKSPLSIKQTSEILTNLQQKSPNISFEIVPMSTGGDRNKDAPLLSLGRGTFVKEIELGLLSGDIDIAVHSAKDLPPNIPDGLTIAAATERVDPRDALISQNAMCFKELPFRARIGTSSPRRRAQVLALRSDLDVLPIRGNVGTRIDRVHSDSYDAVVLAAAGLIRLGMGHNITEFMDPEICTPEVGQGTLAIEARSDDTDVLELLSEINHDLTIKMLRAERAFLLALGGGCTVPVTAFARMENGDMNIDAMAALPDGSRIFRTKSLGDFNDPEGTGRSLACKLLNAGARKIIDLGSTNGK
jgi:hydroxymethylbilane synthase